MAKDNQRKTSDPGAKKTNKSKPGSEKNRGKAGWKKPDYVRAAREAGVEGAENMTVRELRTALSKLKQQGVIEDGRKNNGGDKRRGTIELMEASQVQIAEHANEEVYVRVMDLENPGETKRVKMTRTQAIMSSLFSEGVKGNVQASKEYLDRYLGRAKQAIEISGEIKTEEQAMPTQAEAAAAAAYEDALEKGEPVPSPLSQ